MSTATNYKLKRKLATAVVTLKIENEVHVPDLKENGMLIVNTANYSVKNLKLAGYEESPLEDDKILDKYHLKYDDVLYIGDGFVDIPVMEKVLVSVSVPNAHPEVKEVSDIVTNKSGGEGVLVEVAQNLLKAKGIYDKVFEKMRKEIYNA